MSTKPRRTFGSLRTLPSGTVQARHFCPVCSAVHSAHVTFATKGDADTWLASVRSDIARERYVCPTARREAEEATRRAQQTFRGYAAQWLPSRSRSDGTPLRNRTRLLYQRILDRDLLPVFGEAPLGDITTGNVRAWWKKLPSDRRTGNAHAYALLRTILGSAVEDELISMNPATIKGAGQTKRQRAIEPATVPELETIAGAMPPRLAMAVLLAGWCALRFGEVVELRRRDVTTDAVSLRVQRAMTYRDGSTWVGAPKSDAGQREVSVPPHLRETLTSHIQAHAQSGKDGLLFPAPTPGSSGSGPCSCGHPGCAGGHLMSSAMFKWFDPARRTADRADLRFHDLRHTGLTLAAHAGATLPDLMKRAGHSSVDAAQVYMHAARGRDAEIAARMSDLLGR